MSELKTAVMPNSLAKGLSEAEAKALMKRFEPGQVKLKLNRALWPHSYITVCKN